MGEAGRGDPAAVPGRLLQFVQSSKLRQPGERPKQRQLWKDHADAGHSKRVFHRDNRRGDRRPPIDSAIAETSVLTQRRSYAWILRYVLAQAPSPRCITYPTPRRALIS